MSKPISEKKLFLLDMDGTIYLDKTVFPDTIPCLTSVKEKGARYLFLTNNSSKSVKAYVEKLSSMGITATEDDFLTSTDATIVYLKAHYAEKTKMYVFGTTSFKEQLAEAGICVTTELSDTTLRECMLAAKEADIAVEINSAALLSMTKNRSIKELLDLDAMRILSIAKECGCKFTFGSDAHEASAARLFYANYIVAASLEICESDILKI